VPKKINSYRFSYYTESVIDLLHRARTVSVDTMQIVQAMP
jgi:hypothetical protein